MVNLYDAKSRLSSSVDQAAAGAEIVIKAALGRLRLAEPLDVLLGADISPNFRYD